MGWCGKRHLCSGNPQCGTNWWRSMRIRLVMSEPATFMRWGVGGGGDGRQKTEGEGCSRSPKTSHQLSFRKRSRMTKVCFHPGLGGKGQSRNHYTTFTNTHTHSHISLSLLPSAQISVNEKVWPEKAFMCNICNEEVCGWAGCCLN